MPPRKLQHPAIEHLSVTPEILRLVMTGVTEEQARRKPTPDRWSIAEVLEHLSHVEAHGFRHRLDRMLAAKTADMPELEPYDQEEYAAQGAYSDRDAEESLAHWEEQRDNNVEVLRALDSSALMRQGRHTKAGIVTVGDLIHQWAFHDLGHVRQIAELVRMEMYYPGLGPFSMYYSAPA
jgi:uncharacterized damage-inducible protein DinB